MRVGKLKVPDPQLQCFHPRMIKIYLTPICSVFNGGTAVVPPGLSSLRAGRGGKMENVMDQPSTQRHCN